MTTEDFIHKAQAVHGDKYDYSKVEYVNNRTKVTIVKNVGYLQSCGKVTWRLKTSKDVGWIQKNAMAEMAEVA